MSLGQSKEVADHPEATRVMRDELTGVMIYLVRPSSVFGLHVNKSIESNMTTNAREYPIEFKRS